MAAYLHTCSFFRYHNVSDLASLQIVIIPQAKRGECGNENCHLAAQGFWRSARVLEVRKLCVGGGLRRSSSLSVCLLSVTDQTSLGAIRRGLAKKMAENLNFIGRTAM